MANPYTSVTINNYNANPPPDDGTTIPANQLTWAKHKTKIGDPLKTAIEAVDTNVSAALGKVIGGGGITSTSIDYTVVAADQGKLVKATASLTITTPDATDVGSPFVFGVVNLGDGDVTVDGNGSQTINGIDSIALGIGRGALLWTDGSNWFAIGFTSEVRPLPFSTPRGRLTLTTAVPVLTSDVTAAGTVYFTPYQGNTVMLPDADGNWSMFEFSELSQALTDDTKSPAAANSSSLYDMFVWNDAGTIRCTRGPAWSSATSRGTGAGTTQLSLLDGVLTNAVAISNGPGANRGVYVGTIATDGSTKMNMMFAPSAAAGGSANRLDVWNAYNRVDFASICRDSTDSWTYSTATFRAANGNNNNRITFVRGLNEEMASAAYHAVGINSSSAEIRNGVGLDVTDAVTQHASLGGGAQSSTKTPMTGMYGGYPGLGQHFFQAIEWSTATGTTTWYGDNGATQLMMLKAELRM
jgi:hypothetical protein